MAEVRLVHLTRDALEYPECPFNRVGNCWHPKAPNADEPDEDGVIYRWCCTTLNHIPPFKNSTCPFNPAVDGKIVEPEHAIDCMR